MPYFADADEALTYLGGVFDRAAETDGVKDEVHAADLDVQFHYSDPDCTLLVRMHPDGVDVRRGEVDDAADVKLTMPCDIADKFWRGEYNLALGVTKGQVKATGYKKILKLLPLAKPMVPIYTEMIAAKDGSAA